MSVYKGLCVGGPYKGRVKEANTEKVSIPEYRPTTLMAIHGYHNYKFSQDEGVWNYTGTSKEPEN
jgi:hypothetical protein